MVKKTDPEDFVNNIRESAQQIWLAGLGAFAKAQAEGGKVFDTLVKEGTTLQQKTQAAAEEKFGDVGSRWSGMTGDMSARAGQQWDKLESIFEDRTARALTRLGVPSAKQVEALEARVAALTEQVARLEKAAAPPRPAAKRSAARSATQTAAKPAGKASARKRTP
jgi:poly(hydroxyalkanoate) granule-associated protein